MIVFLLSVFIISAFVKLLPQKIRDKIDRMLLSPNTALFGVVVISLLTGILNHMSPPDFKNMLPQAVAAYHYMQLGAFVAGPLRWRFVHGCCFRAGGALRLPLPSKSLRSNKPAERGSGLQKSLTLFASGTLN